MSTVATSHDFAWVRTRYERWHAVGRWPLADVKVLLLEPIAASFVVLDFGAKLDDSPLMVVPARPGEFSCQLRDGFADRPVTVQTRFGPLLAWIVEVRSDGSALLLFLREQAESLMQRCTLSPIASTGIPA